MRAYKFPEILYKLLEEHNMSQMEFADKLFTTQAVVWKWLRKGVMPKLEYLILIAELFDVSIDYLVFGE